MYKRRFYQALVLGLLVALCVIGCSNQHFFNNHKKENISFIFVTPQTSSRSTESDGSIWNIHAWIEKDDGTIIESKLLSATSGSPVLVEFQEIIIDTTIQIKVELQNEAIGKDKYVGSSPFIHLTNNITHVNIDLEYASYGSQANPITNWTDLKSTMERDSAPSQIYIAGNMEALETILFASDNPTEIIAASSTTITRSSSFTSGPLFETATSLTFTGTKDSQITILGNSIAADSPIILAEADLTMTYCTIQNSVNTSVPSSSSPTYGGAIYMTGGTSSIIGATLTLVNCSFDGNKTTNPGNPGGVIYLDQYTNSVSIKNTIFKSNESGGNGGAIYFGNKNNDNILENCAFSGNSSSNGAAFYIDNQSHVVLNNVEIEEDIYLLNSGHISFANQVLISALTWNRGGNDYKEVFTTGYDTHVFADTSSINLTISGTIPTGTLQIFENNTVLTNEQIKCFTVTANDKEYTYTSYGSV